MCRDRQQWQCFEFWIGSKSYHTLLDRDPRSSKPHLTFPLWPAAPFQGPYHYPDDNTSIHLGMMLAHGLPAGFFGTCHGFLMSTTNRNAWWSLVCLLRRAKFSDKYSYINLRSDLRSRQLRHGWSTFDLSLPLNPPSANCLTSRLPPFLCLFSACLAGSPSLCYPLRNILWCCTTAGAGQASSPSGFTSSGLPLLSRDVHRASLLFLGFLWSVDAYGYIQHNALHKHQHVPWCQRQCLFVLRYANYPKPFLFLQAF